MHDPILPGIRRKRHIGSRSSRSDLCGEKINQSDLTSLIAENAIKLIPIVIAAMHSHVALTRASPSSNLAAYWPAHAPYAAKNAAGANFACLARTSSDDERFSGMSYAKS